MIPILYEPDEKIFASNGICRLQDCISCKVTEERNGIYEVEFEYPITGNNYDKIKLGKIVAVTHNDTGDVQPFDLVSMSRPISGIVTFRGVHISYRLNKLATTLRLSGRIDAVMGMLNNEGTGFNFSTDIPSTGNAVLVTHDYPVLIRQYLGGMEGSILDNYGGEYEFDTFNVILHQARGKKKDFAIRYGLNLVGYDEEVDYSGTFNKCLPYWNSNGDLRVGDVQDSGIPPYNGIDNCIPLDLTERFETKPTKAKLKQAALQYMHSNKTYLPEQNIKVDFIRLQDTTEYSQYSSLLTCSLCDTISVVFPQYDTVEDFKIVKVVYDVLAERYESMELGDLQTTLAEALGLNSQPNGNPTMWDIIGSGTAVVQVGDLLIQYGSEAITTGSTSSNSVYTGSASVTFDVEYSKSPMVLLTWAGNWSNQRSLATSDTSTTGFTLYGRTSNANQSRAVKWLAIGQKGN